tara:strand:+ start:1738 stop:2106 length:369 start_codon:yes stop_codon:yes gene_type:complete
MNLDPELIEELKRLDAEMNAPKPEKEYRFYYDDDGRIAMCAEIVPYPDGDKYIVVDKLVYDNYFDYRVLNGKPERIVKEHGQIKASLVKSDSGFRVVKGNAALLLEENEEYQNTEYYDRRTS